jgi:glutamine synthetase
MSKAFFDKVKEHNIEFVDLRFTDPRGVLHHLTQHISTVDADALKDGFMIDGSSIQGWKAINESDMVLKPDADTAQLDPFTAHPTLNVYCDVHDPVLKTPYDRDPRCIAKAAEAYIKTSGVADTAFFGPEAEFFLFDSVKYKSSPYSTFYELEDGELPYTSGHDLPQGNMGHRPGMKGGYFPVAPVDSSVDVRSEMIRAMAAMGLGVEKHHHEVASAQSELGIKFGTLVTAADHLQIYKYVVRNVAHAYGKTATFMPKPVFGDNGSGMHVHQSLWKGGKPLFAGKEYANLSEICLYYIGGILKHAKALNAFTNPTTNSYKRLVPGYEAPVLLAYSQRNRSASCRIPMSGDSPKAKRIEVRFPDPTANPYLSFAAMLMAGLDGIKNKIHPGEANDADLYHLPPKQLAKIPTVCRTLRDAIEALEKDHKFLMEGNVFSQSMIDSYIELLLEDTIAYEMMPHPIEFERYYSR